MGRDVKIICVDSYYVPQKAEIWDCKVIYSDLYNELTSNEGFEAEDIIKYQIPNTFIKEDPYNRADSELFCFDTIVVAFEDFMVFNTDNILINLIKEDIINYRCDYVLFHFF